MRTTLSAWLVGVGMTTVALSGACQQAVSQIPAAAKAGAERGHDLVMVLACNDCHTPMKRGTAGPEFDMSRMLSGHPQDLDLPPAPDLPEGPWVGLGTGTNTAFAGPWGLSYATNLTADGNTGMGNWSEELFLQAMRTGRHMGHSRPILPPMPWPAYAQLSDEDLRAVYAYLRTVPAIINQVPEAVPAPGGNGG